MSLTQKMTANYYLAKFKMRDWVEKVKKEELGASDMVVVIILIVVVVALAGVFRKQITSAIGTYKPQNSGENTNGALNQLYEAMND